MKVLVVEDDVALAERLAALLRDATLGVDLAHDGEQADFLARTERYDAIVLDLGLPVRDGLSVLRDWRDIGLDTPVLILTARSRWPDKAAAFSAGADDYVTKPFEPMEVVVRIQALIRRSQGQSSPVIEVGAASLDTHSGQLLMHGVPVSLTAQEYKLIAYLFLARGRVVSRSELVEHVYERDRDPDSNVIDVLLSRVRKRLGSELIETVRGRGFRVQSGDAVP